MGNSASLLAALALIVGVHTSVQAQRIDSAMVGVWAGRAQIAVSWTQQRELAVRVGIRDDGSVSGTIGDAQLIDGRFANARGPVGRAMRVGREFMIGGRLSGPLIRSEAVQRASVRLSLDWKGQTFEGELQTSGTQEGSAEDMVLSATSLVLRRAGGAVVQREQDGAAGAIERNRGKRRRNVTIRQLAARAIATGAPWTGQSVSVPTFAATSFSSLSSRL